jgi:hypothetical protein
LVEEFEKLNTQWIFLQNPFGDTPQGKLLTHGSLKSHIGSEKCCGSRV